MQHRFYYTGYVIRNCCSDILEIIHRVFCLSSTNTMLQEIINNIVDNRYSEVLSYNPQTDEKVKYKKKNKAWEIPRIFRKPV